jgi:heme exporter protein D
MAATVDEPVKTGGWRLWLAGATAVVCAVLLVLVACGLDRETVSDKADQQSLDFGLPVAWLHQDQTSLDPPFPARVSVASPLENPTDLSGLAFLVDLLVVLAALGVVVLVVRQVSRRESQNQKYDAL